MENIVKFNVSILGGLLNDFCVVIGGLFGIVVVCVSSDLFIIFKS